MFILYGMKGQIKIINSYIKTVIAKRYYEQAIAITEQCIINFPQKRLYLFYKMFFVNITQHSITIIDVIIYNQKKYNKALDCYDQSISLDQNSIIAYNNKGIGAFKDIKRF
ncbi:unnamed protein product [Paramecium primaurelia]|uniref:Tetratricopeptide repeat protein n=1 Tax=Paramecium primaurelia TaxID=5886 RepID=A0A8S1L6J9_PARPR|nr:unnamed protein product [Paramecium primaurelia]